MQSAAASALGSAAKNGIDISLAIPNMNNILIVSCANSDNLAPKHLVVESLYVAAENRIDIRAAVPGLIVLLGELNKNFVQESWYTRQLVASALGAAAKNGIDISGAVLGLIILLDDSNVQGYAAEALGYAAKMGTDITPAIPKLRELLDSTDEFTLSCVSFALARAGQ